MNTFCSIDECTQEELNSYGITNEVLERLDYIGGNRSYLFIDKNEWAFPIVYFDLITSFEFRFTTFQGDWSDESQLSRFKTQLSRHIHSQSN